MSCIPTVREIDALGTRCPQPIIELARALKNHPQEQDFLLISDDPATAHDLTAWARMTGNEIEQLSFDRFVVTRKE